jgi:hypothetical protein
MVSTKNPILVIIASTLVYVLLLALPLESIVGNTDLSTFQSENLVELIKNIFIILISILAIKKAKVFELSGLIASSKWSHKYLLIIPFYLILIGALQLLKEDFTAVNSIDIWFLLLTTMSIGFSEEFVFRGFMNSVLLKKYHKNKRGIFLSVLLPAILFGSLHLLNFKIENISGEISQFLYAVFFGVFFGAVLLKTNKLLPIAIIHGLIDFVFGFDGLFNEVATKEETNMLSEVISAIASSVVVLPLFIIGILILKKIKPEDITQKITSLKS